MVGFLGKDDDFSLRVWSMVGWPKSSGWSHTYEYMAAQIGLRKLQKKKQKEDIKLGGRRDVGEWIWGVRENSKVHLWSKYILEILKELIKIYTKASKHIIYNSKYIISMYIIIHLEDNNKTQNHVGGGWLFCFTEHFMKLAIGCLKWKRNIDFTF